MNKVTVYFILSIATLLFLSSCSKNDSATDEPLRDYTEQHTAEKAMIEDYLQKNYIEVINAPGEAKDQDVTIAALDATHTVSIWAQTIYPLKTRIVNLNGIEYTVYYLELRQGTGISPTNLDEVLTSYKGSYLSSSTDTATNLTTVSATLFEEINFPQSYFSLYTDDPDISVYKTIRGWSEIFPKFKQGTYSTRSDGTIKYENFGAGVMFLPSGLGYFANGSTTIPAYSPLVFSFKLYDVKRLDQDGDGIPSYSEDRNADGYMYDYRNTTSYPIPPATNIDDTDGDSIPNFIDVDDDGDGYTTKIEISKGTDYLDKNSHP